MTIRIAASFTRFPYGIRRRIRREIRLPVKFRFGQRFDTGCVRRRVTRRRARRHRFRRAQCEPHGFQPHAHFGLRVKMCVWLGVSRGLDLAFLNAD